MPDFCEPLKGCQDLDGKLLLQRAVYGPQLAFDPGPVTFGGIASRGAALRPLLHIRFELQWKAMGLCYGQPTSVMGLAPGEVVKVGLRTRSTRTFTSLVRTAAERSLRATPVVPSGSGLFSGLDQVLTGLAGAAGAALGTGGSGSGNAFFDEAEKRIDSIKSELQRQVERVGEDKEREVELVALVVDKISSIVQGPLGAAMAPLAAGAASGLSTVNAVSGIGDATGISVSDLVDNFVGGEGIAETMQQISEVVEAVERSESESSLRETTITTSTESEQTVTRTFGNPYLDRSLQLRFIPVFQRFKVTTRVVKGTAALSTVAAERDEPATQESRGVTPQDQEPALRRELAVGRLGARPSLKLAISAASRAGAESSLRETMLSAVQKARQASQGTSANVLLEEGLAWDGTTSVGNAIHVPLATAGIVSKAWRLKQEVTKRLEEALAKLKPDGIEKVAPKPVERVVHVFAGLHVEPVPGECVLPGIPEHLRVIVPSGTSYGLMPPTSK